MANYYMFIALMIAIAVVCLWFALRIAKSVQKSIDEDKKRSEKAESSVGWLTHIHWIIGAFGGIGGGLKYAYKSWQTAPAGSLRKLGWEALVAVLALLALWAILKYIDKKLNGYEAPNYNQTDDLASQTAVRQMGENN